MMTAAQKIKIGKLYELPATTNNAAMIAIISDVSALDDAPRGK
jgi:hypothetical protein